ncbi:MAG: DEAD/DEAH box helicase family protein [Bacteroidales bacterium]|nr:DEAD/DEAH box helicase family protein [Bacteroidales bacterium]
MEINEIKGIVLEILEDIDKSSQGSTTRRYNAFLRRIGMSKKKNLKVLDIFDTIFKKHNITLWSGETEYSEISLFDRGQTVTFKLQANTKRSRGRTSKTRKNSPKAAPEISNFREFKIKYKNAGSIDIERSDSGIILYKHQVEAINRLQEKIIKQNKNPFAGLLVLPTGGGKTLTAAHWIARNYLDKNKKVLWIAHRHELLDQAKKTFHELLAFKDIFQNRTRFNYRILSGIHDKPVNVKSTDDIIIASKDSLNAGFNHLYKNWIKGKTSEMLLVIDEAHHAVAKTYRKLIDNVKVKVDVFRMLGLTATPFRTAEDEQGLLHKVFYDDIIYKIDLRTLINRGILSEPIFEEVETNVDMTSILSDRDLENIRYFDIDVIGRKTAKTIAQNDKRNWTIVNKYKQNKKKYKQTLVFALNQDNAIALNKLFQENNIKSEYVLAAIRDQVTGVTISSKQNKDKIERFRKGQVDVLISVNILTEGVDVPNVQSVFLARPTISPILMTQMIGRGLRGEKAGGTKEAFIVSFIDDWKDKVAWINPEKLLIEENTDFNDTRTETKEKLVRLISIHKIEEFAILTNKIIDTATKEALEKLDFIERVPLGIYQFSILKQEKIDEGAKDKVDIRIEEREKNCEVLVYDNLKSSYAQFVNGLDRFFRDNKLTDKDFLTDEELGQYSAIIEEEFFHGCPKHPCYVPQDIKDIIQYYAQTDTLPKFIELSDREKYDINNVANEIKNLSDQEETERINILWESNENAWKAFFGFDNKRYFVQEIYLAKMKINHPELFKKQTIVPTDIKELREIEKLSMSELREEYPQYWKYLSDSVYEKYTDKDGYYFSAQSKYRSKYKLDFQIDHIIPMHNGGLTKIENLQLLTRQENARKGKK